jgi:L-seryl-tRNA(Ser) seleniumtransferase
MKRWSYEALGIRPVINASATLTRLGGSRMPREVLDAMAVAAEQFIDILELQQRVGERIAQLTRNEASYVSSGAAAGMALAVASCIAGTDPKRIASLPATEGPPPEVIVHRSQRNGYDHAARMTGARLVEIGLAHATQPWELEAAISPRTVCVLYFAGAHFAGAARPLDEVVRVAHERQIPVIVDAAAQIPPVASLWHFTRELGADAVIFSGGKGLRGPQSAGLVLGRRQLIDGCVANGPPNHSLGRPMKVGKEEMLGMLTAVECALSQDEPALLEWYEATVQGWLAGLAGVPGICVERGYPSEAGQPHARAVVHLTAESPMSRDELVSALWDRTPRVAVGLHGTDAIALNPQTLEPGEESLVLDAVRDALGARRTN